jgi:hypothetical protein
MLVNRNDERAWESYYTLQANKTKQGDATYEENDEFSTLTLEDQLGCGPVSQVVNRTVLHQDVLGSIPTHDWTWHESITFSNDKIS